jgi:hypothetical protein
VERRPDPEPYRADEVRLVAGGTVLWALGLLTLLVLKAVGTDVHGWWITMCIAGIVLGLLGTRTCLRRRSAGAP